MARQTMRTQNATASCRRRRVDALQLSFGIRSETCRKGRTSEGGKAGSCRIHYIGRNGKVHSPEINSTRRQRWRFVFSAGKARRSISSRLRTRSDTESDPGGRGEACGGGLRCAQPLARRRKSQGHRLPAAAVSSSSTGETREQRNASPVGPRQSCDNAFYEGGRLPSAAGTCLASHAGDRSVEITPQSASDQRKNSAATVKHASQPETG